MAGTILDGAKKPRWKAVLASKKAKTWMITWPKGERVIKDLKRFCAERNLNYKSMYDGKENSGFIAKRYTPETEVPE